MGAPDQELRDALWRPPTEEPPAPVTRKRGSFLMVLSASVLSLFLPGAGQLLNRTSRRAAIVFVIWLFAWITHLTPVWTVICLYAGIEAGITAWKGRPVTA